MLPFQYQVPLSHGEQLKLTVAVQLPGSDPMRAPNGADSVPNPPLKSSVIPLAKAQPYSEHGDGEVISPLNVQSAVNRIV